MIDTSITAKTRMRRGRVEAENSRKYKKLKTFKQNGRRPKEKGNGVGSTTQSESKENLRGTKFLSVG